jgi:hypothetical protein
VESIIIVSPFFNAFGTIVVINLIFVNQQN